MPEHREPPPSPKAEHILIALGVIGGFILVGSLMFMILRMRSLNIGEKFDDFLDGNPRLERVLSVIPAIRKRNRWFRAASSPGWDTRDTHSDDEKSPVIVPAPSTHDSTDYSGSKSPIGSYGSLSNGGILTITNPSPPTMSLYTVQQPANAYIPNAARMSELSSLSSGFGDAQIDIPESGPINGMGTLNSTYDPNGNSTLNTNAAMINSLPKYRASFMQRASRAFPEPLNSRFSWTIANELEIPAGQRDTMYTTTSEDSAPRFRTINSWVDQQTHRVERGKTEPVPSMPPLPPSQRLLSRRSESPPFRVHPGEEIAIPEAKRVESAILDSKVGAADP